MQASRKCRLLFYQEDSITVEPRRNRRKRSGRRRGAKKDNLSEGWGMRQCKRRLSGEGERGNIFHFPFPSSLCQGFSHYHLKLIWALCRRIRGEMGEEGCVRLTQLTKKWELKIVENSVREQQPREMWLLISSPSFFGRRNWVLKRSESWRTVI